MAKVNFNNLAPESNSGSNNQVTFLNLKDGEDVIVRVMIDSLDDIDIHTVHNVEMQGYQYGRRMNCLRTPQDPIEMCPLCQSGKQLQQKIFVRLIQYVPNSNGQVELHAKVWERSINDRNFGAHALKSYLDTYGPLSDMVCKIVRRGEKLNTEYQFIPNLPANIYRPDVYVKDTSIFGDYSPIGHAILDKTAEEYRIFLQTGSFPATSSNNVNASNQPPVSIPPSTGAYSNTPSDITPRTYEPAVTPQVATQPTPFNTGVPANPNFIPGVAPNIPQATTNPGTMPWSNVPQGVERPRRY